VLRFCWADILSHGYELFGVREGRSSLLVILSGVTLIHHPSQILIERDKFASVRLSFGFVSLQEGGTCPSAEDVSDLPCCGSVLGTAVREGMEGDDTDVMPVCHAGVRALTCVGRVEMTCVSD
jgi:hypothetical protein